MKVPDNVFARFCAELEAAKQSGKLDKNIFKKILGYDMTWPGFAEDALARLEELGCSRAREYYEAVRLGWQQEHEQQMRNVAEWYSKQNFDRKKVRESRTEQEAEPSMKKLHLLKQKQEVLNKKLRLLRQKQAVQSMTKESSAQ